MAAEVAAEVAGEVAGEVAAEVAARVPAEPGVEAGRGVPGLPVAGGAVATGAAGVARADRLRALSASVCADTAVGRMAGAFADRRCVCHPRRSSGRYGGRPGGL